MKRLLFYITITLSLLSLNCSAQDFLKTNAVRSAFGEANLLYEYQLPNDRWAAELKVGYAYKMPILQFFSRTKSGLTPTYFLYYPDGLNSGYVLGAGIIRYYGKEEKNYYLKLAANFKSLEMKNVEMALSDYQDGNSNVKAIVDGTHIIFNPQLSWGYNTKTKVAVSPYFGIGVTYRESRITDATCTGQFPIGWTGPDDCIRFARHRRNLYHSNNVFPSIHCGFLIGIRTRDRRD